MAESPTPICDLIERLLSTGMSTVDIMSAARPTEAALLRTTTTARASTPKDRQKWAGQKKRQRTTSTRMSTAGLDSKNPNDSIGSKKKEPGVDISPDGWPDNFGEQFWTAFPPFRRQARVKVEQKLARIRAAGAVPWSVLFGGVLKFAATNPGEYAPAPMVWLNDGRWDREYGTPQQNGGTNGSRFGGAQQQPRGGDAVFAAARRRAGAGDGRSDPPGAAGPVPPAGGLAANRRAGPGGCGPDDLDLRCGPGPERDV